MLAWGHDLIAILGNDPIVAAGKAICVLAHLRTAFKKKKLFFEEQGFRKRKLPQFWLISIPEIGSFAEQFEVFNNIVRSLFLDDECFHLLDWAAEVRLHRHANRVENLFSKEAIEERFCQLFKQCCHKLDLTYFRYMEEKMKYRQISWEKRDYDSI